MRRRSVLMLPFTALLPEASFAADPASTVFSSAGTLPLILTVPHDGGEFLGLIPVRTRGVIVRDMGTRQLAERLASRLETRLGKRPYLVIAKVSRKYLDVNRTEQDAMESLDALPAYRAYHDQIAAFVAEMRKQFPAAALLIDVHGQGAEPNITFRGTRAGLTATSLLKRFGAQALQGEKSIIGGLAARGYGVFPPIGATSLKEDRRFDGGHTVFTYGSQRDAGIDAVQLEFGKRQRDDARFAEDLAEALIGFMTEYELLSKK